MSIYADKALTKYNITYKELESLWVDVYVKTDKKKQFWTDVYVFSNDDEYQIWKEWCIKKVGEEKFPMIDMLYCLGQPYLFKEAIVQDDSEY